jgi:ribonuclease Y
MGVPLISILVGAVCAVAGIIIGQYGRSLTDKKYKDAREQEARKNAELLLKEARQEAELQKKTAILEAKDEWFKAKTEFDRDASRTRDAIRQEQQRVKEQDNELKRREELIAKRETEFTARESFLNSKERRSEQKTTNSPASSPRRMKSSKKFLT